MVYSLCESDPETAEHLFFKCLYSAYIWELCRLKLGMKQGPIETLQAYVFIISSTFKHTVRINGLARLVICMSVWHI